MKKCQVCGSGRVAHISAKHADCFSMECELDEVHISGDYAPDIDGLCGDDYTEFDVCLDCGQMQGEFPKDKVMV